MRFVRSPGPGGQNVNKVATGVELRFDARNSTVLPELVKSKVISLAGARATSLGEIVIQAHRYRTQERNRQDALDRLAALILRATKKPKPRRKTGPTKASRERRLTQKRQRSVVKALRGRVSNEE